MSAFKFAAIQLAKAGLLIAVFATLAFLSQSVSPGDLAPFAGLLRATVYAGAYFYIPRVIERKRGVALSPELLRSVRTWVVVAAVVIEAANVFLLVKYYGS